MNNSEDCWINRSWEWILDIHRWQLWWRQHYSPSSGSSSHHTYSRLDIMKVKILIEWPFFISNRFLIEIDIEINKETKKENHLNHEQNEFCILYQYSFGGYDVILLFSIKQLKKNVFNYWMNQSDTTIILFPYRIDYSIDSHKLIELIEIL